MPVVYDEDKAPSGRVVYDSQVATSGSAPERTWGEALNDTGLSVVQGLTGVAKLPAMLLDKGITGQWVGPGVEALSEFEDAVQGRYSPALKGRQQAAQVNIARAGQAAEQWAGGGDGFVPSAARVLAEFGVGAKEFVSDPMLLASEAAKQVPMLGASRLGGLATDALARGAAAVAPRVAATKAGTVALGAAGTGGAIATGAGLQAADIGTDTYARLVALPDEQWAANVPGFKELAAQIGPQEAKSRLASSKAAQAAVQAGIASLLSTALPGGASVERALVGKGLTGASIPRAAAKAFAGEAGQEGVEEGYGQLASNEAVRGVNPAQRMIEGVGGAAGQGAALGGLMGGGVAAAHAARDLYRARAEATPAAEPPAGAPSAIPAADVLDEPKPSAAEAALAPRGLTDLDRVAEIDRTLAAMPVQETGATPERAALELERADLSRTWPATVKGQPTTFSTEAGARVDGEYALIEADELQASHDTDLRPNPAYPADLQPRDRTRAASEAQIASIVGRLDPARLGQSATAADGAPIIGADGLVESGNARTIALQRVYRANGQKAENYKAWLREASAAVGLSPEQVDGMRQPVLVRVRTTPVNRAEFARQANASTVAAMSPLEQARSDAARIDALDDLRPDENGDFASSRDFIRRFVGRLPATEQSGLIDSGGALSASGYARVRNAVLAKAYGDSPVLTRMVESMDDNLRNVSRALLIAAPRVAQSRAAIKEGRRFDADITPHLVGAVEELGRIKDAGGSVADALAQAGLMGDERTPEARDLLAFLSENARRPRRMAEFITAYFDALDAAGDPAQGSLMGETVAPTTGELMAAARREQGGNDGSPSQDAGRGHAGEVARTGERSPGGPAAAPGGGSGAQGNAAPAANAGQVDSDWRAFGPETGTLGVPRAEMPQVKVARRGELLEFLQGRGIGHARLNLPADSLKPTQAEYSPAKTDSAAHLAEEQSDRAAVLVSSDGYVLDGHHRWLARSEAHQPVWAIQFDAPIGKLLDAVMQFPGTHVSKDSEGAVTPSARDLAVQDFKNAAADLGEFLTKYARAAIVPHDSPEAHKVLVRLFDAAIRIVGSDLKRAVAWVKNYLREHKDEIKGWNKIQPIAYRKAAEEALDGLELRGQQMGLFSESEQVQADLFAAPAAVASPQAKQPAPDGETAAKPAGAAPAVAMIDGRPYDYGRDGDNFKPPSVVEFLSKDEIAHADRLVERYYTNRPAPAISAEDRARAEALLQPLIEKAKADKVTFDQKIVDIAKRVGALGQMLPPEIKGIKRAAEKLAVEENFNLDGMKDMLRSTIVVSSYADAQRVLDEIAAEFKLLRAPKNRTGGTGLTLNGQALAAQDPAQFGGYTDLMVNIRMPSGVIAEIQVNVPEMLGAKDAQGHKLYEAAREAPKDSPLGVEIVNAMRGFYDPVSAAVERRLAAASASNPAGSVENVMPPRGAPARPGAMLGRGSSVEPSSESLNQPLPGMSANQSPPKVGTNSEPAGNLSGTLIASTSPIVPEGGENPYTSGKGKSSDVAPDANDREGDAGSRPGSARAVEGKRRTDAVPAPDGGADQQPGGVGVDGSGAEGGDLQAGGAASGAGQQTQGPGKQRHGKRARRGAAVPAGRDLKPKSGLNYRFTDEDISPPGSWRQRAAANVAAVELVKKLQAEKRQATPEEQRVLARFVGWGASEIAQNLFSKKLDKAAGALEAYERATEALKKRGADVLRGAEAGRYGYGRRYPDDGYYDALQVLRYDDPKTYGNYGLPAEITREQLDNAAPPKAMREWLALRDRLRDALTDDELAEAARSTQYGHYTSADIVRGMWRALDRFGFKGGLVLEPGSGKGNFPGLMPDALAANSAYTGIEYDSITGAILGHLFPDEFTRTESYVDTKLPRDFYDVGIGNPPFAGLSVLADPEYKRHAFKLHDYFFAKTIDRVRPGGLLLFVTSRYTMDKQGDKARQYLAERADLLGAIRLPQTAFKENAGTEVVTDVLFLRKKVPGEVFEHGQAWLQSVPVDVAGAPESVNEYFAAHPDMILGTPSRAGSMYRKDEYTVEAPAGDIAELFNAAVDRLPSDVMAAARGSAAEAAAVRELDFNPTAKKEGNYYVNAKGIVMQREGGVGVAALGLSKEAEAAIKSFVPLRDALKQAQYDQLNDGDWETSLKALQSAYKAFTDAHGPINQSKLREARVKVDVLDDEGEPTGEKEWGVEERRVYPLRDMLRDDPESTLVAALENVNEDTGAVTPSEFLSKRVLGERKSADIATPHDAMLAVLNDLGRVDMAEIADRLDMDEADVISALGSAVYLNPQGGWETADEYLSGDVVRKLELAEAAAKNDRRYERNLEPLRAARPAAKGPSAIDIAIGMNWIPGSLYEAFLRETAGVNSSIVWNDATRQWAVAFPDKSKARSTASHLRDQATVEWGTSQRHAGELLEHALTGRPVMIRKKVAAEGGGEKEVIDAPAIEAANQKLEALKAEFGKWVWRDAERAGFIVKTYNDKFNVIAPRSFDGRHLTLPGTSALFNVFDHVKRGAWRIIQSGNTYLAHAVGAGKTFEMVISAMEQKRLGLIKKPMVVVPNHMLRQFASEWQQLYPAARLMVADEVEFHKDKRRRFVSRVALSDLDGVIITHSAFKLLDIDPAFREKIVEEQLDQLRAALEDADDGEDGGRKSPRIKQIEKRIETLEQKLKAAHKAEAKDQNARFDELGVDMLYVDEAHLYRKLDFGTSRQVKGISSEGSDAALDLYVKTRWLDEKKPGRSLVMASGTPITNTLAELYSVQRYLGRQVLIDKGIEDFDSWAAMFGREKTALEANASGKYEPVTRFSEFVNVPGLIQMFKQFADVLTADNLAAMLGDKRPKVQGGARKIIVTPKTTRYRHYQRSLAARVDASRAWKPSKDEPNNPDPMIRIIGDGRLAAIDMRFVSPGAPNDPNSKFNRMIDDVIAAYKETAELEYHDRKGKVEPNKGATMMVFSDLGFGAGVTANRGFNARAWMDKRLREAGVPAKHVAFMSDYKKASEKMRLFNDVNAGRVRILVGSSKNMGTGVNAQQRLLDLFHIDSPWFPADLEQREGRIIRQGNKNREVRVRAYAALGSYDSVMWGMLARKGFFIDQAMQGDPNVDRIEDLDSVSHYAQASAMAASDPRILQLAGIRADIEKTQRLYQAHEDQRLKFRERYRRAAGFIDMARKQLPEAEAAAAKVVDLSGDKFTAAVGSAAYTERKAWGQALKDAARHLASGVERTQEIGRISGFPIVFASTRTESSFFWYVSLKTPVPETLISRGDEDPVQIALSAQRAVADVLRLPAKLREGIESNEAERDALQARLEAPFPMAELLAAKQREAAELEAEIAQSSKDRPWRVERTDTGMFLTVMAHNEETAIDKGMEQLGGEPEVWSAIELDQVREYDDEESTLAAAMGMIPPAHAFMSRGGVGGIALPALQGVASRIAAKLTGLPKVNVLASPADAPAALREFIQKRGATADVEGALHDGEIYLFASGIEDETRAEHVLAEHEAAHAGLAAMLGAGRVQAMQALYNQNADIRRATKPMIDRGMDLAEAVEEVIVEIPSARLARLKGWRLLVGKMRDALAKLGFERLAAQLDGWLSGHLTEQQRADLAVADLVRAARGFVAKQRVARLADDAAAQEKWLMREARARGFKDIDDLAERAYPVFENLAATWRRKHPAAAMLSVAASTKAFKDWFGASVVTENGRAGGAPLVVYHGTGSDISAFDVSKTKAIDGIFMTPEAGYANQVAAATRGNGGAPNVMPLYVSLKNPRVIDVQAGDYYNTNSLNAAMSDGSADGVIVKGEDGNIHVVIAFRPEQIKSAIGNRGTFDPSNRDIRLSRARPAFKPVDTDSDGFRAWFKDSKVVNTTKYSRDYGKPLKVYHSSVASFDAFATQPGDIGMHFGTAGQAEDRFWVKAGSAPVGATHNTLPVYLSIQNPLRLDDLGSWTAGRMRLALAQKFPKDRREIEGLKASMHVRRFLESKGYDGIVYANTGETQGGAAFRAAKEAAAADFEKAFPRFKGQVWTDEMKQHPAYVAYWKADQLYQAVLAQNAEDSYIALRPTQIKSALSNAGSFDSANPDIRLSAGAATATAPPTPAQRAEAVIQTAAGTPKPLDALAHTLTRVTGLERLTAATHGLGARLLDRITPERVKAGVVSDYGVPEAVIDRRALLQGHQREQLRQAGRLLEKLATMTRQESRVAYEWMNGEDTRTADEIMADLPEESVKVLREVRTLIDGLSQEAVRLGQLDPQAFERHRFAYLRRSYFKHAQELTGAEKTARQRAISILGDQYRGRGIVLQAAMRQIQNIAPEWWKRKTVAGKADTSLKGERFERLERRAAAGAGTASLDGMGENTRPAKVLEVHYWPHGEPKPATYADWDSAGVFEAIDTKGGELTLWRDFTKDERVKMGEIDEARYAIAKTLQRMIHDVEVGRYLEWLAQNHGKASATPRDIGLGSVVEASERYRDSFTRDEWVQVPDTTIPGTSVKKYGKLAGRYITGPIWNDLRQVVGGRYMPLGETYHDILRLWKMSKTALSPAVHMNNVMSNVVMADWHDVSAGHVAKALRIVLGASARDARGLLGRAGNAAGGLGIADREVAREVLSRYENSGGAIGGWVTQEIAEEQLAPIVEALQRELATTAAAAAPAEIGVYSALQHALHARFPQAWQAFKASRPAGAVATDAKNLLDLYQAEDDVFRLAAWLKAKEGGASDADAGKAARRSFLDYSINAPWVQAMRSTAFPFISFTYRAVPMLIETAAKRPHKILKLMMVLGALNALGGMLAGGGGDDEDEARKLLPDEKAGRIWGLVPKLIRMPWNDAHGSPVFLDIRRWIPVGDVFDLGQGHAALPVPPALMPGGPLAVLGEVVFDRSMFTGKPITLETDTALEQAGKIADHLWKAATPNILGVPGTYATQGVADAMRGRTDTFGRELSVPQALASSVGVKLGSYPPDVLRRNLQSKARAEIAEIDDQMRALTRQRVTNRIDQDEFEAAMRRQDEKKRRVVQELGESVE